MPAMLTNVATALFGLADMWVIGRLGDAAAQGAVELGAKFMMALLVVFNFLRTSTVALTAQAAGRGDADEQAATLVRAAGAAILIGVLLLLVRPFAIPLGLEILQAKGQVAGYAATYVGIRYWAGTAWLLNAVLAGWLIGRRRMRTILAVEVGANLAHIALDLTFVLGFGWGVAGVAAATFCSELLKLVALVAVTFREPAARGAAGMLGSSSIWRGEALRRLFSLNRDLFLRTLLLTSAMLIFARSGAQQGAVILAANGILFQIFMLSTLILDGFESAAQVMCGEAKGSNDRTQFVASVRANLICGLATGVAISLIYALGVTRFAASFSTDPQVVATAADYTIWVMILPILGVASFVLDGVFVGAVWTRAMLVTMIVALAGYVALLLALPLTNHWLWAAFSLFFLMRAGGQFLAMPRLVRRDFAPMSQ